MPTHVKVVLPDNEIETELVQVAIGIVPNTALFQGTGLEMTPNGAIITEESMQTNIPHVFAAGDCVAVHQMFVENLVYYPLALAANRQGRLAGQNIVADAESATMKRFAPISATQICKILDLYCAKTGLSEKQVKN